MATRRRNSSSRSTPPASDPVPRVPRSLRRPVFSQPEPTPDPTIFRIKHPSDADAYKAIDALNKEHRLAALPFPAPRGGVEPRLTLRDVFAGNGPAIDAIKKSGQIVFHATGDCGSTRGPKTQNEVTDKMIGDFKESKPMEAPQFALLLGDVVYNFGEMEYYYDQFYEPYRNYPAPVLAAAGNHDGMISPLAHATSLAAYLRNFCADPAQGFTVTPEAGGLSRTAQIQPGVFFSFDAPFVRILVFYSNTLEDPGVIANSAIGQSQLDFPYVTCGNGGHNVQKLQAPQGIALRTPQILQRKSAHDDAVIFENYDDTHYGYLRLIVNAAQLRIEYHPASDGVGVKTPDASVTIDLASRKPVLYVANDLGLPASALAVRRRQARQSARGKTSGKG